ncbi:hypothetical protein [Aggregatibacter actinomycetemcomitans]|uniref:hypothetical protein n=1 Tax=Aggregatibacter actinomycetemcomitans TaxID=714 RepID=UPI001F1212A0|nr:hypothetical protein [Aggregatibacter actinomycetemcomitans]
MTQPPTEILQYQEHILLSVDNQQVTADYMTQTHILNMHSDDLPTTLYISEINVYWDGHPNSKDVFFDICTLRDIQSGNIHNDVVPSFKTSSAQMSLEKDYTVEIRISRPKRAFFCTSILSEEEYRRGKTHPNDPFDKREIALQIKNRLDEPYPDQDETSLCGPAAFYYCLLKDRPDIYDKAAKLLWTYGKVKIGDLEIKPGYDCRHPSRIDGVSALDWFTLASLRDSSNIFRDYDEVSDQVSGITLPGGLVDWFTEIGSKNLYKNTNMLFSRRLVDLVSLNECYMNNLHTMIFVAHKIIRGENAINSKDHWIVLSSKIEVNGQKITENSPMDGIITIRFFTWGNIEGFSNQITLGEFLNHFYGGLAFLPVT